MPSPSENAAEKERERIQKMRRKFAEAGLCIYCGKRPRAPRRRFRSNLPGMSGPGELNEHWRRGFVKACLVCTKKANKRSRAQYDRKLKDAGRGRVRS